MFSGSNIQRIVFPFRLLFYDAKNIIVLKTLELEFKENSQVDKLQRLIFKRTISMSIQLEIFLWICDVLTRSKPFNI